MRILITKENYESYMAEAEELVLLDPEIGTKEADRLELLYNWIEIYEKQYKLVDYNG